MNTILTEAERRRFEFLREYFSTVRNSSDALREGAIFEYYSCSKSLSPKAVELALRRRDEAIEFAVLIEKAYGSKDF